MPFSIDDTAPRLRAVRRRGMTWLQLYRSDIARYNSIVLAYHC